MPGDRDDAPTQPYALIADDTGDVAFLDAPTMAVGELATAIDQGFAVLRPGAVLTVYSGHVTRAAFVELCAPLGLGVVATITHPAGGTTFTVKANP